MAIQTLYPNQKPSLLLDFANVKALDPRVSFVRTTTATYYDGKTVAKAEENLLEHSEDMNQIGSDRVVITANTETAPNGTNTADTVAGTAAVSNHRIRKDLPAAGQTYAVSIFAKKNASDFLQIIINNSSGGSYVTAVYDLANGTVSETDTLSGTITSTAITNVGNGWYRCSLVGTSTNSTLASFTLAPLATGNTFQTNFGWIQYDASADSLFLWGAQLEQRSAVTAYTPTTTQPITNYIPVLLTAAAGQARLHHNPTTGESLGLLVEEQRTNGLTYSAEIGGTDWTVGATSDVILADAISPAGTQTATRLYPLSSGSFRGLQQSKTFDASQTRTFSVYAKAAGINSIFMEVTDSTGGYGWRSFFNLNDGTLGNVTSLGSFPTGVGQRRIEAVGNGWYRCSIIFPLDTTRGNITHLSRVRTADNGTTTTSTAAGQNGVLLWGAQNEQGAFPTSYIPTVAATVTRNADAASMTGANFTSWYRADEGTLYAEGSSAAGNTTQGNFFNINDGTNQNRLFLVDKENATTFGFQVDVNGSAQANIIGGTFTAGAFAKLSAAYKVNDFALYSNNASIGTDTVGTIPVVTRMEIGANQSAVQQLNGYIRKIAYYPIRATNAQLQALTS
jgi:hypothetical protein